MNNREGITDDFDETWILNLQELLDTLEPQIRESNAVQLLEDFLSSLESTDPNFHRYSFVRQIKDKLESDLTPLIDDLIKQHEVTSGDNMIASDISNKLTQSEEFVKASTSILDYVRMAAENLTTHLKSDTFDFTEEHLKHDDKGSFHGYESICSTNDGLDLMFMPPNNYKTLAKELDPVKSLDTRLKSLAALQQVPQTDLVASDAWDVTRRGLLCALDDENEEVHLQALTFLSQLFVSGSSHVVKEYFMILIENMIEYFTDSTSHMVSIEAGLDLGDRRNIYLLRKFRLLNQIQEELPSFWLRYSDKYIEDITQYVFNLLQFIPTPISDTIGENLVTPLHFLALLDPLALWFKFWMHGLYGRSQIIKSLRLHTKFLLKPVQICIGLPAKLKSIDINQFVVQESDEEYIYTSADISYTYFLHSMSIVGRLMLYKDGCDLLNLTLPDGTVINTNTIILTFIEILKIFPIGDLNIAKSLYHPVFLIVDIFSSFINNGGDRCQQAMCDSHVCDELVQLIKDLQENPNVDESKINVIADILVEIASTKSGRSQLIYSEIGSKLPCSENTGIHLIAKSLTSLLDQTTHDNISRNTLTSLLSLCSHIYTTCEGVIVLKKYKLNEKIYKCLINHKDKLDFLSEKFKNPNDSEQDTSGALLSFRKMANHEQVTYKSCMNLVQELLDNMLDFCMTPKGVQLVEECRGLDECVMYVFEKCHSYQQRTSNMDKYSSEMLLSQISVTEPGVAALNKAGYVASLLQDAWFHLEGYSNDYTKIVLSEIPDDLTHRISKKLFVSMVKLLSNFDAVYELFGKLQPRDNDDKTTQLQTTLDITTQPTLKKVQRQTSLDFDNNDEDIKPSNKLQIKEVNNFNEFVTNLVLVDSSDKRNLLYHPEQTHFFALNVFGCMVRCLDTMLFLQTNLRFQESLLKLQLMCRLEHNTFIIDQCSIKRNEILVATYVLGGVSERFVPPDKLTEDGDSPYPWQLFCTYPLPDMYTLKVLNPAIGPAKKKSAFESYLPEIVHTDWSTCEKRDEIIETIRVMFVEEMKANLLKSSDRMMCMVMDVVVDIYCTDPKHSMLTFDEKVTRQTKKMKLSESDELAIDMVARYGHVVRVVSSVTEASDILKTLLLQWKSHLSDAQLLSHVTQHKPFDWFLALMGLLFSNDKTSAWNFIKKFSTLVHSVYLWASRYSMSDRPDGRSSIHPIFSNVCHHVELLLQNELPQVYAAFRLSGYSPSQICYLWLRQCFLNFMDWAEIVCYISTCVVMGIDYQVYFTLAVFKHLEKDILYHTQNNDLVVFLKSVPIKDFKLAQYLDYMKKLEERYRHALLQDLLDL